MRDILGTFGIGFVVGNWFYGPVGGLFLGCTTCLIFSVGLFVWSTWKL